MNKKRIFIIHGWDRSPEKDWLPWMKQNLERENFDVFVPAMPNPEEPKIKEWINHLSKIVNEPDENTYFIGHSIGCQTVIRYLESLDGKKVGGVIFVAGFFKLTGLETEEEKKIAKPWLETPIDFNKVKSATNNFIAIFSDNDPFVPLEINKKIFKEKLNAKIVIKKNKGHFDEYSGVFEIPILLKEVSELIHKGK